MRIKRRKLYSAVRNTYLHLEAFGFWCAFLHHYTDDAVVHLSAVWAERMYMMEKKEYRILSGAEFFNVDERVAKEFGKILNAQRYQMRKRNACRVTRKTFWKCEAVCVGCEYNAENNESIDDPAFSWRVNVEANGSCTGYQNIEDIESIFAWKQRLAAIVPDGDRIAELWIRGMTDSEISRELGISTSTMFDRKMKIRKALEEEMGKR